MKSALKHKFAKDSILEQTEPEFVLNNGLSRVPVTHAGHANYPNRIGWVRGDCIAVNRIGWVRGDSTGVILSQLNFPYEDPRTEYLLSMVHDCQSQHFGHPSGKFKQKTHSRSPKTERPREPKI